MSVWAICQPWRLRDLDEFDGHPLGAHCEPCRRDVAADRAWSGRIMCIYCAIERGWIEDAPIGENIRTRVDEGATSPNVYRAPSPTPHTRPDDKSGEGNHGSE